MINDNNFDRQISDTVISDKELKGYMLYGHVSPCVEKILFFVRPQPQNQLFFANPSSYQRAYSLKHLSKAILSTILRFCNLTISGNSL